MLLVFILHPNNNKLQSIWVLSRTQELAKGIQQAIRSETTFSNIQPYPAVNKATLYLHHHSDSKF